jgi:hypothetical protein
MSKNGFYIKIFLKSSGRFLEQFAKFNSSKTKNRVLNCRDVSEKFGIILGIVWKRYDDSISQIDISIYATVSLLFFSRPFLLNSARARPRSCVCSHRSWRCVV